MNHKSLYDTSICLVDIGAAGGIHHRWDKFKNIHVLGFEPDQRAFTKLPSDNKYSWFNTALFNKKGEFPLFITKAPTNTSMLKPNYNLINMLAYTEGDFDTISTTNIQCDTLDAICSQHSFLPDVIKVDTQGSELAILEGALHYLQKSIFAVETEVEFMPLYENQPLFTDIHNFMLKNRFQLMDYGNILHVKFKNTKGIGGAKSNLISGDALYFKEVDYVVDSIINDDSNLDAIIGICISYGYQDYASEICMRLVAKTDNISEKLKNYISLLKKSHSTSRKIINKINLSDKKIRRYTRLVQKLIPVKHASWLPGLGND